MLCQKCEKFNDNKAKFCNHCGADFAEMKGAKKKIRVSPAQRTYIYLEIRLQELTEHKLKLSGRLNTPPQGFIGRLVGNSGEKVTKLRLDNVDARISDLEKVYAMLGGVGAV